MQGYSSDTIGGTGGELRCPLPYSAKEYIRLHVPKINAPLVAIIPTAETLVMRAVFEKRETALTCWSNS